MKHVMLDLETLDTGPDAAIISIGAVAFDRQTLTIDDGTFYQAITIGTVTGVIDPDTVEWWMQQSAEARAVFKDPTAVPESHALLAFSDWVRDVSGPALDQVEVWGNGAAFDNVILRATYARNGYIPPWKWRNDRCYRSVKALFPSVDAAPLYSVRHNALDDAMTQAAILLECFRQLDKRL